MMHATDKPLDLWDFFANPNIKSNLKLKLFYLS
jgi:hypothetical protein